MRNWLAGLFLTVVVFLVFLAGFFAVLPLFELDFKVGASHIMTGTNPSGWSQGLTTMPDRDPAAPHDSHMLVLGKFYWYLMPAGNNYDNLP